MEKKINSKAFIFKLALLITFLTTIIVTTVIMGSKNEVNAVYVYDANNTMWSFKINNNTYEINDIYCANLGNASVDELVIPSTIRYGTYDYTVRSVGYGSSSSSYRFPDTVKRIVIPDTITKINNYAFYYCGELESIEIGSGVKEIGNYAFGYCKKLESITLPEGLEKIGAAAFQTCSNLSGTVVFPKTLNDVQYNPFVQCPNVTGIKIGDEFPISMVYNIFNINNIVTVDVYEDSDVYKKEDGIIFSKDGKRIYLAEKKDYENYVVPNGVTSIEAKAFSFAKSMTGTLTLPEGLQSIGNSAFAGKNGITGHLRIPDSVTSIGTNAFTNIKTFDRVTLGSGITRVEAYTFSDLEDLFVNNVIGSVEFNENYCDSNPVVHFLNSTKHVVVNKAPGVKLINVDTGAEVDTGDYIDETTFRYRIDVENGYNYDHLELVWYDDNKYETFTNAAVEAGREYDFPPLLRVRNIYVQNLNDSIDLSLRMFITEVNRNPLSKSRVPDTSVGTEFEYAHTKEPVKVKKGDRVTYRVRVYNEALQTARATEITVHIPEGLEFDPENSTNKNNGWLQDGNTIKTSQLAFDDIHSYLGNGIVNYKDVDICLTVTDDSVDNEVYKTVFAEISRESGTDDDSTPGNVAVSQNYRIDEITNSNSTSFIVDQEDDDDFDTIVLNSKIRVEYNLRIEKIDKDTDELLAGAKFELISAGANEIIKDGELKKYEDEEVIARTTSDENGIVDFGGITTYGEGENIFWIKEIDAPSGYLTNIGKKMKVKVVKTILDEEAGTYSVKVYCESSDYAVDTSHFEFTPVSNAEQLAKIGSGEIVNVDGVDYEYNINSNYKLTNDIDLSGINWTPIDKSIVGIIDGDGHKISNLTIVLDEQNTIPKVGLISEFTGIIENLTLENPNIHMTTLAEGVTDTTDYTGVGAFVGFMKQGYIYNCKTTVTEGATAEITAGIDNIGGFVGHTAPNGLVTIINSENNIDVLGTDIVDEPGITAVKGSDNVGGFIGCSLGSVSIQNSKNTGRINAGRYGAGGLVGFVRPTDYEELSITAGYDEDNKRIDLLVENEAAKGQYNLTLEIRDRKTNRLIGGAIYEVDKIEDNIKTALLETGSLKLFDKAIEYTGKDVYFMTEEETVPGYNLLSGIIRVDIDRYWDNEAKTYRVRAEATIITHKEYEEFIGNRSTNEDEAKTGKIFDKGAVFTDVNIERANWNGCKIEVSNCTNDGSISAGKGNAAGMIGTAYGVVTAENCINNGNIDSGKKAGGIVAEIKAVNDSYRGEGDPAQKPNLPQGSLDYSMFTNCINNGSILGRNGTASSGGLVAEIEGFAKFVKATNNGEISTTQQTTGGIVGKTYGAIIIEDSINNGKITASSGTSYSDNSTIIGGILGQAGIDEYSVELITYDQVNSTIKNCKNNGELYCNNGYNNAGMIGNASGNITSILNCEVIGESEENKLKIHSNSTGEMGGMIGLSSCKVTNIKDCKIENVDIRITDDFEDSNITAHRTVGGMLGISDKGGYVAANDIYSGGCNREQVNISNCVVNNSILINKGAEAAGIMAKNSGSYGNVEDDYMATIYDCTVKNSLIASYSDTGSSYVNASGIYGGGYQCRGCDIKYCNVVDSTLEVRGFEEGSFAGGAGTSTVSGIFGRANYPVRQNIEECNVINCKLTSKTKEQGSCGNTAGIYGVVYGQKQAITIKNCNVKNSEIADYNTCVGGILGGAMSDSGSYEDRGTFIIEGCNVIETNITRPGEEHELPNQYSSPTNYSCVGGIAGSLQELKNITIKDTKVIGKNIEKDADNAGERNVIFSHFGNVAGAVGMMRYNRINMSNVEIKNYDIINEVSMYKDSTNQTQVGGIIGSVVHATDWGADNYKNILVENVNIKGNKTMNAGGFAGTFRANPGTIVENAKVKNSYISSNNTFTDNQYYGIVAGLVAHDGATSTYDSPTEVYSEYRNCSVEDSIISAKKHLAAGGIGHVNSKIVAKNCTIKNVEIRDNWEEPSEIEDVVSQLYTHRNFAGFIAMSRYTELDNIKVSNVNINARYASIGGIYGTATNVALLNNCTVEDCEFTSTKSITGKDGACAGIGATTIEMTGKPTNNKVSNVAITTDYHVNAGMFGYIGNKNLYPITLNDSTVENVTLTHENKSLEYNIAHEPNDETVPILYNPLMAGVVGVTAADTNINNATVKDTTITGKDGLYMHMGGIIAISDSNINIDNSKVINTKLTNRTGASMTGGMVGLNVRYKDSTQLSPTTTVTNSSIEQDSEIIGSNQVGGLVAFAKVQMDNNKILNTTIKADKTIYTAGAALGLSKEPGSIINRITVKDFSIPDGDNVPIAAGGIVGQLDGTLKNSTATDITIITNQSAGGAVATYQNPSSEIDNVTVTNATITSKQQHAAGIATVAFGTISNAKVYNSTIKSEAGNMAGGISATTNNTISDVIVDGSTISSAGHNAGGVVASTWSTITNAKVTDTTVNGNMLVGGIAATISGPLTTVEVDNVTVKANGNSSIAGGIAACANGAITTSRVKDSEIVSTMLGGGVAGFSREAINDARVTNTSITSGDDVGGIAGVIPSTITNVTVTESTITANKLAGGIVGTTEYEIKDATVDGSTIISKQLHVGGITACTKGKLNNCTTKDSTIKTLSGTFNSGVDVFPTCLGGLVGAGYKTEGGVLQPEIVNSQVENNTLTGATGTSVGKYIGGPMELNDNLVAAEATQP